VGVRQLPGGDPHRLAGIEASGPREPRARRLTLAAAAPPDVGEPLADIGRYVGAQASPGGRRRRPQCAYVWAAPKSARRP
jgi:hypothetical protein